MNEEQGSTESPPVPAEVRAVVAKIAVDIDLRWGVRPPAEEVLQWEHLVAAAAKAVAQSRRPLALEAKEIVGEYVAQGSASMPDDDAGLMLESLGQDIAVLAELNPLNPNLCAAMAYIGRGMHRLALYREELEAPRV